MKNVEDIYPVSPMQEVMLLHTMSRRGNDSLLNQIVFVSNGKLNVAAFEDAWQLVIQRHPMLRTTFIVDKVKAPLQVVRKTVTLKFDVADWRDLDADAQRQRLHQYRETDRAAGVNPARAPMMRMFLARTAQESWYFVWTSHHLQMDRWCLDSVLGDVARFYEQVCAGRKPMVATAPSFRRYINWIADQDRAAALRYWSSALRGFDQPTPVDPVARATNPHIAQRTLTLDADERSQLLACARARGVTISTLVQAAWALTLHKFTDAHDVVFGIAVAARPPAIAQVESIVGSFVNNLPVRVRLHADQPVAQWLKQIQGEAYARSAFDYLAPTDIHRCSDIADGEALFDNLMVWLAPTDAVVQLPLTPVDGELATAYPFTLSVEERNDSLVFHVRRRAAPDGHARAVLETLAASLKTLAVSQPDARMQDLPGIRASDAPLPVAAESTIVPGASLTNARAVDPQFSGGREALDTASIRQLVHDEMCAVLGVDTVSHSDDFFDLGGDSIRAAQMHARLVASTRKNVPLLTLFQRPTVQEMARTLKAQRWPITPGIAIALQTRGAGAPLFYVASPEVNTLGYFVLSRNLQPPRPSFVLQAPPSHQDVRQMQPHTIPALASDYVAAMRAVAPHGPYQILGTCGGAHIAVEMARQLHAVGEKTSFLGVINTWAFYTVSLSYYAHRLRNVSRYYLSQLRSRLPFARGKPAAPRKSAASAMPRHRPEDDPRDDVGLNNPWIRDVGFAHCDPGGAKLPGTMHVFRLSRQQYWRIRDRGLGWGKQVENVTVIDLLGNSHDAILREPQVQEVAQHLAAALSDLAAHESKQLTPLLTATTISTGGLS